MKFKLDQDIKLGNHLVKKGSIVKIVSNSDVRRVNAKEYLRESATDKTEIDVLFSKLMNSDNITPEDRKRLREIMHSLKKSSRDVLEGVGNVTRVPYPKRGYREDAVEDIDVKRDPRSLGRGKRRRSSEEYTPEIVDLSSDLTQETREASTKRKAYNDILKNVEEYLMDSGKDVKDIDRVLNKLDNSLKPLFL